MEKESHFKTVAEKASNDLKRNLDNTETRLRRMGFNKPSDADTEILNGEVKDLSKLVDRLMAEIRAKESGSITPIECNYIEESLRRKVQDFFFKSGGRSN